MKNFSSTQARLSRYTSVRGRAFPLDKKIIYAKQVINPTEIMKARAKSAYISRVSVKNIGESEGVDDNLGRFIAISL